MYDYWSVEIRRLIGVIVLALVVGFISGVWLPTALIVAVGYIAWSLYKLRQLQLWLVKGARAEQLPDSDGAWEQIAYLIHRAQQKHNNRKKKQTELIARFSNIITALPDAAVLFDDQYLIQWSNRYAYTLLGIDERRDHGQRIDNLLRNPEIWQALNENETASEIQFISPRNENINLVARLLPVQNNLWLLNVRDISQRVQLQRTRRAFIANASHELRTPLTVISGYLEILDDNPEISEPLRPAIHQARLQALRMQQIIDDMLTLSRLENNEIAAKQTEQVVNMSRIVRAICTDIQHTIAQHSHTLSSEITSELMITGIERDLTSVATNLIDNAVKHTPVGTHIHVVWQLNGDGCPTFIVSDNGSGIPEEHIDHLTERFYRVDSGRSREKGGTGLGLSIVKHVIQNHQGTLQITSQPGNTRFEAVFPLERLYMESELEVDGLLGEVA